jgi:flagellar assembly protein FliH
MIGVAGPGDRARVPAGRTVAPAAPALPTPPGPPQSGREVDPAPDWEIVKQLLTRLTESADHLQGQQRHTLDELRRLAVELGMAIARRLVHEKIAADEFGIETLVRSAIERLQTDQPVVIRLNPKDIELLEHKLSGEWNTLHASASVRVVPDAGLARGDCRAQTGDVGVWSNLEQQLRQIHEILLEGIPQAGKNA